MEPEEALKLPIDEGTQINNFCDLYNYYDASPRFHLFLCLLFFQQILMSRCHLG